MRLLVLSGLYPNAAMPQHGIFVENRLRALLAADAGIDAEVLAPVPWFPSRATVFGSYARFAAVPECEERHGIRIAHPRYLAIPKIGAALSPWAVWQSARPALRRMLQEGEGPDLIDAHFMYPYGVAAAMLAREFGLPLAITARGSDIRVHGRHPATARKIVAAAEAADGLIAVSESLADAMAEIGIARERIAVLRNGVNTEVFRPDPVSAAELAVRLGLERPVLAMVANLVPLKGHALVLEAFAKRGRGSMLIAGDGPERGRLDRLVDSLGIAGRVHFLGTLPPEGVRAVFSAADVTLLASRSEGWPNVLLESMACGTPVVVSPFAGAEEIVNAPAAGRIAAARDSGAIATALDGLLAAPPPRSSVRGHAEGFSWEPTTRGQIRLFNEILDRRRNFRAS